MVALWRRLGSDKKAPSGNSVICLVQVNNPFIRKQLEEFFLAYPFLKFFEILSNVSLADLDGLCRRSGLVL